jgi:hypothetical protein
VLWSDGFVGAEGVFVSLHRFARDGSDPTRAGDEVVGVEVSGRCVEIVCSDGERFLVQVVAPEPLDRTLGGVRLEGPVRFARVSPDGTRFVHAPEG